MKRSLLLLFFIFPALLLQAESIKLKNGTIINGSIVEQTEYSIIIATPQGSFPLNTREIEKISPDKHRIFLKGGTQLIGTIQDLDEFNLKLLTDEGVLVNIDMPQIVSVEVYDYDQADQTQQVIEKKMQEAQAAQAHAQQTASLPGTAALLPGTTAAEAEKVAAPGGLSFDNDIEKVFEAKKAKVVQGQVVTDSLVDQGQTMVAAPRALTDEEAFLKGNSATNEIKTHEAVVLPDQKQAFAKATAKPGKVSDKPKFNEQDTRKYFALELGTISQGLTLNNTARLGEEKQDVGGNGVLVSGKFLWRVKNSNLWAGPMLSLSNIPNNSFVDKDPNIQIANDTALADGQEIPFPDPKVKTSGQVITIGANANYYLTPKSLVMLYLTGSVGYEMLTLNYRGELQSDSISSNGIVAGLGIGAEMRIDDLMLGVEIKEHMASRAKELKDSDSANLSISAKLAWKF